MHCSGRQDVGIHESQWKRHILTGLTRDLCGGDPSGLQFVNGAQWGLMGLNGG